MHILTFVKIGISYNKVWGQLNYEVSIVLMALVGDHFQLYQNIVDNYNSPSIKFSVYSRENS